MTRHMQTIIELLPMISAEERKELHQRLAMMDSLATDNSRDDEWVLQCLVEQLSSMGVEHPAVSLLLKSPQIKSFRDKLPGVLQFLEDGGLKELNEKRLMMRTGARLLYEDLVSMDIAVTSRKIMEHFHRMPAVINRAFPSYAANGMLKMLVYRQRKTGLYV